MNILLINNITRFLHPLKNVLKPHEVTITDFNCISPEDAGNYDAIILSGGHKFDVKSHDKEYSKEIRIIKNSNTKILGICLGFQLICHVFNCKLEKLPKLEKGILDIKIIRQDKILEGISSLKVFEDHRWAVKNVKPLMPLAKSKDGIEIIRHPNKPIYGMQFHPEMFVKKTNGIQIVNNFLNL